MVLFAADHVKHLCTAAAAANDDDDNDKD